MESMTRIIVPMPAELVRDLDDYRYSRRVPSRAEAIRRLLIAALRTLGDTSVEGMGRATRTRTAPAKAPRK
jgi:metal-responsive CopG/Arc/MetJ family transcriptional regulator